MASGDYPTTVNGQIVSIGNDNPCHVTKDMIGLSDVAVRSTNTISYYKEDTSSAFWRKREDIKAVINPDTDVAIECIKQIAICNGKCPKKISDGETDDLQCPCIDFIYHGNCSFGLFIEK